MENLFQLPEFTLFIAILIGLVGGFVKGVVGFGLPMIIISGLASVLPADVALAALIVPTVVANGYQALRQGAFAAWQAATKFKIFLITLVGFLWFSAQFVSAISQEFFFMLIGVPVVVFCFLQLIGWRVKISPERRGLGSVFFGTFAGLSGGVSGIWGPPTIAFLTAIDADKDEQMRVQGVIYGVGSVVLFGAHLSSGVLNEQTLPLSAFLVVPTLLGMYFGGKLHDKWPQAVFRRATLIVLSLVGLNLIRKGLFGM